MKPQKFYYAIFFIFIAATVLRFYALPSPPDQIFDEVYFPVFAQDYLTQTDFFDAHPPLGKLIIAGSIRLFGNNPLGWRYFNALTGLMLLAVGAGLAYDLTGRRESALLALTLMAIDPMALVESRVGLINIYLAFFSLLGLWFGWRWWKGKNAPWLNYILALVFFSGAAAVKWIGLGALGAMVLFIILAYVLLKISPPRITWKHILLLLIIPAIYLSIFIPDALRGQDIVWWHTSAYNYHAHLNATHPYGANWWTWPIVQRPIWLYFKSVRPGTIRGIIELGNVVTWIGGLIALFTSLIGFRFLAKNKRPTYLFVITTYFSLYLPWIAISRVKFIYHYFVPVLILLILLAVALDDFIFSYPQRKWLGYVFLLAGAAFFFYFVPLLIGYPIPEAFYKQHMWFRSWI